MIGTRTPFRISFLGGGSDLPVFYSRHTGCVLSTSINKYMHIFVHPFFDDRIQVKYSKTELADMPDQINHPIVRTALMKFGLRGIDINSIADIPAGTGLGSSCSFTVGLLHALYAYVRKYPSKEKLAREACDLEIGDLGEPIGKQDQYAAAYGGLNMITFHADEKVNVEPVIMPKGKLVELESSLLMFYVGGTRSASGVLADQKKNLQKSDAQFQNLVRMTEQARTMRQAFERGDIWELGAALDEGWQLKKSLSGQISGSRIDHFYEKGLKNGALGGKLLGAGGSGFLLFQAPFAEHDRLRHALSDLREMKFAFDHFGTKVSLVDELDD